MNAISQLVQLYRGYILIFQRMNITLPDSVTSVHSKK